MGCCHYCGYECSVYIFGAPWHPRCYEEVRLRRDVGKAGAIVTEAHIEALRSGKGRGLPDARLRPTYAPLADILTYSTADIAAGVRALLTEG